MEKIQVGKVRLNKTWKYVLPCLKEYGEVFIQKINSIYKVAVGLGDMVLVNNGVRYEQHVFILVDTKLAPDFFKEFISWIPTQDMYEDDYCYDNVLHGRFHMIVLKLPEIFWDIPLIFRRSQFSQMYTREEVAKYFTDLQVKGILIKEGDEYIIEHTKNINKIFGTTVKPQEIEGEWDFPIKKEEEIFDNHLKEIKVEH